jgi:steroid 5-alpha reductase family enzyme
LTAFYLLQRGVGWSEAAQVAPFLFVVQSLLGYLGSRSTAPWHWVDWVALGLYIVGSLLNTGSEFQRKRWKLDPDHRGHLYTRGLFSLSMHINYFGDALLFTGFALLTTSLWTLLIPLLMTALFVFVHIPTLDGYLANRYPGEFAEWARQSKKFVPFLY